MELELELDRLIDITLTHIIKYLIYFLFLLGDFYESICNQNENQKLKKKKMYKLKQKTLYKLLVPGGAYERKWFGLLGCLIRIYHNIFL